MHPERSSSLSREWLSVAGPFTLAKVDGRVERSSEAANSAHARGACPDPPTLTLRATQHAPSSSRYRVELLACLLRSLPSRSCRDGVSVQVEAEPGPAVVDAVRLEHPLVRRPEGSLRPRTDERPVRQTRTWRQSSLRRRKEVSLTLPAVVVIVSLSEGGELEGTREAEGPDRGAHLARTSNGRPRAHIEPANVPCLKMPRYERRRSLA